jgi:ketosteroid isomerase-like protein
MVRSGIAVFSALWRAYGEGRLDRSLHLVDADCELVLPGETTLRGHDGVRELLSSGRREWRTVTIVYDEVSETRPDCVVCIGRVAASSADGDAKLERPIACVAEFRDGRLVRGRVFDDRDAAERYARGLERAD